VKKTKHLFAGLILLVSGLGTLQAEECPSKIMEGSVCLPKGFPVESTPGGYSLNLMRGHTQLSNDVYDLHMLILWICVFVGIGVFGTMFYSIYHHRKSKGHAAEQFHENTTVEIIWTIIPALILLAMAIPATKTLMEMDDVQDSDMTVKVTGWQWKWEYDYLDSGIHFFSNLDDASNRARQLGSNIDSRSVPHYLLRVDEPLVIPVNKKIRYVFTAHEVLHSWWVPDLGWKKDAIPGFINEAWASVDEPGIYRGQCTELCGKDHAFMPVVVIAMEQDDYDAWAEKKRLEICKGKSAVDLPHNDLVAKGSEVYATNCATCHMPDGAGIPGAFPALRNSPVVNGDINAQATLILNGKNAMPAFGKQLSATELASVITYTRNALGNSKDDEIQPKAIKAKLPESADDDDCTKPVKVDNDAKPAKEEAASGKGDNDEKPQGNADKSAVDNENKVANTAIVGKTIYETNCVSCHQKDGGGIPPVFPALTGSLVVKGNINAQAKLVLKGKGSMPAFGGKLTAVELAEVITYTRNALGNSIGDAIKADEIEKLLQGKDEAQKVSDEKTTGAAEMGLDELATQGESVYEKNCQSCHQKDGVGMPPVFPALKGSAVVTGAIDAQVEIMLKGKGAMPAFGKKLNPVDFASVLAFTRNKLGNSTGDFKQPSAIEALQSGSE
jgi:cytochrome c oxidase subunit II